MNFSFVSISMMSQCCSAAALKRIVQHVELKFSNFTLNLLFIFFCSLAFSFECFAYQHQIWREWEKKDEKLINCSDYDDDADGGWARSNEPRVHHYWLGWIEWMVMWSDSQGCVFSLCVVFPLYKYMNKCIFDRIMIRQSMMNGWESCKAHKTQGLAKSDVM